MSRPAPLPREVARIGDPAVRMLRDPGEALAARTGDQDRQSRDGLGHEVGGFHHGAVARLDAWKFFRQHPADDGEIVAKEDVALVPVDAESRELNRAIAGSNAEDESPACQLFDRCGRLCGMERVAQGQNDGSRRQCDRRRMRRNPAQPRPRIVDLSEISEIGSRRGTSGSRDRRSRALLRAAQGDAGHAWSVRLDRRTRLGRTRRAIAGRARTCAGSRPNRRWTQLSGP
jgi:hypothetical protein